MVEFVTLFLGLVVGPIEVELAVDDRVAAVVLELDGERVGELTGPPWRRRMDLGERLRPHRLTARALDGQRRELDRAVRYLNLHRPPAEVRFFLSRNAAGWVTRIGLAWESRSGASPERWRVTVDGRPVAADDPSRISLPPLDPGQLHVIEAEVEFSDRVTARDRIGVGGRFLDETSAPLTAVAATVADAADMPGPEETSAVRLADGRPLRVVAVERGEARFVYVRGPSARNGVRRLMTVGARQGSLPGVKDALVKRVAEAVPLRADESLRILYPLGFELSDGAHHRWLFPMTPSIDREDGGGVFWHLTTADPRGNVRPETRLADGVAIAGSQAASDSLRRAVVLLLDSASHDDGSLVDPARVRAYLDDLGVPLHVWYLGKTVKAPKEWGPVASVRTLAALEQELDAVRAALERQRIVWIEGLHLPQEVMVRFRGASARSGAEAP